jgi:hypothetical protein
MGKPLPKEATKEMILAGETELENCIDTDFDSGPDGSSYQYHTVHSDAPAKIWRAMVKAWEETSN